MDAASLLREARIARGLTQRELAALAGLPQPAIARIESGASSPRVDTLDRLLAACGRSIAATHLSPPVDPDEWTLVQGNLQLTPAQRLAKLAAWAAFVTKLRRAGEAGRAR
ncbi:MAG TPA: helix-turn-helix transcriptional regulator [Acidimicrobiales bacterium]|nr:helix-turn-helix transcriptional regulator [Acidimicrobiales bacterium]